MRTTLRKFEVSLVINENEEVEFELSEGGIMRVRFISSGNGEYMTAVNYVLNMLESELVTGFEEYQVIMDGGYDN